MPFLIIYVCVIIESKIAKKLAINYIIRFCQCQINLKKRAEAFISPVEGNSDSRLILYNRPKSKTNAHEKMGLHLSA